MWVLTNVLHLKTVGAARTGHCGKHLISPLLLELLPRAMMWYSVAGLLLSIPRREDGGLFQFVEGFAASYGQPLQE